MRIPLIWVVILLPLAALAENIEHTQHLELSIEDVRSLQITCGPGFLDVYGVEGYDRIKVTATVQVAGISQQQLPDFLAQHVRLSLTKRSHNARLQSTFQNQSMMPADAKIDLSVAVPINLRVAIDDGSGWIAVGGLNSNLAVKDGSGSISISGIRGNVKIEDGSGKIQIADVRGDLEVKDGSGSIQIDRIKGDVNVIDGSGDMTIQDIDGNLAIRDGSGGIEINTVTQNVLIKEAGSGNLDIEGVRGRTVTWE